MVDSDAASSAPPGRSGFIAGPPTDSVLLRRGFSGQLEMLRGILEDAGIPAVLELETGRSLDARALGPGGADASLHVPRERFDDARKAIEEAHDSGAKVGEIAEEASRGSGRFAKPAPEPSEVEGPWTESLRLEARARLVYFLGISSIAFAYLFIAPFALAGVAMLNARIREAEKRGVPVSSQTRSYARSAFIMALVAVAVLPVLVTVILAFGFGER